MSREAGKSMRKNGTVIPVKHTKTFLCDGTLDNQPRCRMCDQNKNTYAGRLYIPGQWNVRCERFRHRV